MSLTSTGDMNYY